MKEMIYCLHWTDTNEGVINDYYFNNYFMMKIVLLPIICLCVMATNFQLNLYEPADCSYCKFAAGQIKSLINQYHWYDKLKLVAIDCSKKKHACRDQLSKPLLILLNQNKQKIAQIAGVHSKLYFRDWISQHIDNNPMQISEITSTDKYKRMHIKNPQETVEFFKNESVRRMKIKKDKLDILYAAFVVSVNETISQNETALPNSDNGNFQNDFRKLAMIGLPVLFMVSLYALVRSRNSVRPRRRQYSMPVPDEQD